MQSAADANLVLLRREENHIIIDNDPVSVKNWRVDQILTSDLFGLESARPKETEELLIERTSILSKSRMTAKDRRRLSELDERIGPLPVGETPEEIKADFLIKEIAKKISESENSQQKGSHD